MESALISVDPKNVILVHNGSLPNHLKALQEKFPQVDHLVIEKNMGFSGGANAGLKYAFQHSEWVLFLTNDCQLIELKPPPQALTPMQIAPMIWARKVGKTDSLGGILDIPKAHLSHCKDEFTFTNINRTSTSQKAYIPGTAFWLNRSAFELAKGFDENLGTYWEDVDFSIHLAQLGGNLSTDSETKILHGIGKTCHKISFYTTYLYQRNRKKVCLRHANSMTIKAQVLCYLLISWSKLFFSQLRKGDFSRAQLLMKAILD